MTVLVFLEKEGQSIRKTSFEAISYAVEAVKEGNSDVVGVVFGEMETTELHQAFKYGCDRIIHINNPEFNQAMINVYAHALAKLMIGENAGLFITAQSALADPVAAKVSIQINASIATNVCELPQSGEAFIVKRSIFSGKAFENVVLTKEKKVLSIKKNSAGLIENPKDPQIIVSDQNIEEGDVDAVITDSEKSTGNVLLPEADIVVSGGRGLKGPENWGMIEDLANELGAAKGCSKPVSDVGWRPHHEHVGQTGIKVSPNLYIAIGISGAIQHIAGVSSSKVIVVINNDPEAPFFKNADYGIVGDAFDVVPKLIEVIRNNK
jgi:electron transfer flavoprotein alpha subunit